MELHLHCTRINSWIYHNDWSHECDLALALEDFCDRLEVTNRQKKRWSQLWISYMNTRLAYVLTDVKCQRLQGGKFGNVRQRNLFCLPMCRLSSVGSSSTCNDIIVIVNGETLFKALPTGRRVWNFITSGVWICIFVTCKFHRYNQTAE